eukprot:CAMPEP_0119344642 /NCGR_PEP_ID=MMETSP1333-20130426/107073_1 /TAXON_ID=418940 /ORGANISM="Scyphosphaera apsteinii, Strain RCC1455" /LENGTH=1032 /DNA_ID=CAMNT_0007357083 /DNA_START=75 /DNA_END=3173 /DNA_ORIENTATION=+
MRVKGWCLLSFLTASNAYCLERPPSTLKLLVTASENITFKLGYGAWNSPQPIAEMIEILVTEKLHYGVEKTMLFSSEELLQHVAGCTGICESASDFQDPPKTAMAAFEVWLSTPAERKLAKIPSLLDSGETGYTSNPTLFTFNSTIAAAFPRAMLQWWESYLPNISQASDISTSGNNVEASWCAGAACGSSDSGSGGSAGQMCLECPGDASVFFSSVRSLDLAIRQIGIRPMCAEGEAQSENYRTRMQDAGLAPCEDGWWYSPTCRSNKEACVPVVLGVPDWNMIEYCTLAETTGLPFAITWLGPGFEWSAAVIAVQALYTSHSFLFYSWMPDSTFLQLVPQLPMPVAFDDLLLAVSQVQRTRKVVWRGLHSSSPSIDSLIRKMSIDQATINDLMHDMSNGVSAYRSACSWLQKHNDTWEEWIRLEHPNIQIQNVTVEADNNDLVMAVSIGTPVIATILCLVSSLFFYLRRARRKLSMQREAHNAAKFRSTATGKVPTLSLPASLKYHLLVSYVWRSGQDQATLIKRSLVARLQQPLIFLDVDDLDDISRLEEYVNSASVILVLLSRGYFISKNAMRELTAALDGNKPIILLHESDNEHGGQSLDEFKASCPDYIRHRVFDGADAPQIIQWHRLAEFQLCALLQIAEVLVKHCGEDPSTPKQKLLQDAHSHSCTEKMTNRSGDRSCATADIDFIPSQQRLEMDGQGSGSGSDSFVADRIKSPWLLPRHMRLMKRAVSLYTPDAITHQAIQRPRNLLLFVSDNNLGAAEVAQDLLNFITVEYTTGPSANAATTSSCVSKRLPMMSKGERIAKLGMKPVVGLAVHPIEVTRDIRDCYSCISSEVSGRKQSATRGRHDDVRYTMMLLLLSRKTFNSGNGEVDEQLAEQLRLMRQASVPIVALHLQDGDDAVDFEHFFYVTPNDLIDSGLYHELAVPLFAGKHRRERDVSFKQALMQMVSLDYNRHRRHRHCYVQQHPRNESTTCRMSFRSEDTIRSRALRKLSLNGIQRFAYASEDAVERLSRAQVDAERVEHKF